MRTVAEEVLGRERRSETEGGDETKRRRRRGSEG